MKVKPNFFIVGAAKSGTTSLYHYLGQHPDIYFSPIKEPNYFSDDIEVSKFSSIYKRNTFLNTEKYFSEDILKDLSISFVRDFAYYERLFKQGSKFKTRGEASTSYLYSNTAAKNIYNFNPKAKIIVVVRNPMERAFSHYKMALRSGHTKESFRNAIEKDISKKNKGWGISELFIELGQYFDQLERYFSVFPPNQIKVFLFEDFKNSTETVLKDCFEFLSVENIKVKDKNIYNSAIVPRNTRFNYFLVRSGLKGFFKSLVPKSRLEAIKEMFLKPDKEKLSKEDFDFLVKIYEEDIKKTANLINRDLSSWLIYENN